MISRVFLPPQNDGMWPLQALAYKDSALLFVIPVKCRIRENEKIASLILRAEGDRQVGVCSRG